MLLPPANEVWGKVIFLHPLSLCSQRGGACLSARWDTTPTPLGPCTPPNHAPHPLRDHAPSPAQSMLGDTVNARAVRILLECNFVMMAPHLPWTAPAPITPSPGQHRLQPPSEQPPPPFAPLTFFHIVLKRRRKSKKEFLG